MDNIDCEVLRNRKSEISQIVKELNAEEANLENRIESIQKEIFFKMGALALIDELLSLEAKEEAVN